MQKMRFESKLQEIPEVFELAKSNRVVMKEDGKRREVFRRWLRAIGL